MSIKLQLDDAVAIANVNGEGIWDLSVNIEESDDLTKIWLVYANEFLGSDNFMNDFEYRRAIYPIEEAIKEQSGNADFYFDAYDYAGRFVGTL